MVKKVIGLIVIITGVLLLLSNLDVVSFDDMSGIIFSLGIMIVGTAGIMEKKRFDFILSMFVIFGALYFLSNIDIISRNTVDVIFWPIIIVVIGLTFFFSVGRKMTTDKPVSSYLAIFSGVEDKNISEEYISSEITAIFGGAEIDYRKIKIKDKVGYVNVTAIFGGATIIVPEEVKVTVKGLPIFGGAENKAVIVKDAKKELIINYTAVFGGLDIKN